MDLITITDPMSPISEAYRTLRTNLSFYSLDAPLRTLVVTTPSPEDTKSTTVANLAVSMAQGGQRTILVDGDLRRPTMHTLFGISNDQGLTDMVLSNELAAPLRATNVENLRVLTSGTKAPNPADLLGSKQVERVIAQLAQDADIVVFDAPPVVSATDAAVLGAKVDGLLLVIRAGSTRRDHSERAKQILENAKVRIVGAALTNSPKDTNVAEY